MDSSKTVFSSNPASSAFKKFGKPIQEQGTSSDPNTLLGLDFSVPPIPILSAGIRSKRKWSSNGTSMGLQKASPLCLNLGHNSSSSPNICSVKETDEESTLKPKIDFSLNIGNRTTFTMKPVAKAKVDLQLSLYTGISTDSDLASVHLDSNTDPPKELDTAHTIQDPSGMKLPLSSVSCISGIFSQGHNISYSTGNKNCMVQACGKRARGASGYCIAHGGGPRCQIEGCFKGADGKTGKCKAHGGGKRCRFVECVRSAEGRTDFCISHGGGNRCTHEGCQRGARGKTKLCIRHGGGKRCSWVQTDLDGNTHPCNKSAEGIPGLCISHGGGKRCQFTGCNKGAQGGTWLCKAHGGGKRCTHKGCTKGAEGSTPFCKSHGGGKRCLFEEGGVCTKSVHGGTLFCVKHGGGKRCIFPECKTSARGRTNYCVRHGGGNRCKFEGGCTKSAQGKTDFCKTHGGSKKCSWGGDDGPCNLPSAGKSGVCVSHGALVQDNRVHGGATLGAIVQDPKEDVSGQMKEFVDIGDKGKQIGAKLFGFAVGHEAELAAPDHAEEGRVHGGSLMWLLSGSSHAGPSKPHNWD